MSRIFKVLLPSCWLLVFSCSSGSGSRVSPIDAFSGEPDAPTAAGGATDTSAPGTGGAQETADLAGAGGAISTGGSALDGGGDSGGGAAGTGGLPATGGSTSSAGTPSTGGTTSTGGATASGGVDAGTGSGTCGDGDPNLPPEPTIPPACATLPATQSVPAGGVPSEASLDTSAIQKALTACASGQAVKLTAGGANNAFVTGPLTLPSGVTLWVDAGTTLYATRDTKVWGAATALVSVSGLNSGIVGDGVIDGQGGEPNLGASQSWWDQNAGSSGNSPALVEVRGATNFTLYRITLHNSPKFHVKLDAAGFVVWGVTIKAPTTASNSAGTALTYSNAHNTDGIDPGEAASDGTIVCSKISTGDDQIAIKGSSATGVKHLVIAHNHFGAGHGMSIGSEFTGGVSDINVYDLSIDGLNMGTSGGSSNGIRIKSDTSRGGLVNNVSYSDVCVRNLSNPILLTPKYSTATGAFIPQYTNIKIQNFHGLAGGSNTPLVTLDGYDSSHMNSVTLDNVIIDGISAANVTASYTSVTLGPGNVNFIPSGTSVNVTNSISGSSTPNPCTGKWVTF
jgi:polygalacturonase